MSISWEGQTGFVPHKPHQQWAVCHCNDMEGWFFYYTFKIFYYRNTILDDWSEAYFCSQAASLYSIEKHESFDFLLVQCSLCERLLGTTPPSQTFPATRASAYGSDSFLVNACVRCSLRISIQNTSIYSLRKSQLANAAPDVMCKIQ